MNVYVIFDTVTKKYRTHAGWIDGLSSQLTPKICYSLKEAKKEFSEVITREYYTAYNIGEKESQKYPNIYFDQRRSAGSVAISKILALRFKIVGFEKDNSSAIKNVEITHARMKAKNLSYSTSFKTSLSASDYFSCTLNGRYYGNTQAQQFDFFGKMNNAVHVFSLGTSNYRLKGTYHYSGVKPEPYPALIFSCSEMNNNPTTSKIKLHTMNVHTTEPGKFGQEIK